MGVFGIGLGGIDVGAGLRDLFGPAAVVQPPHGRFLRRGLRLGGFELRLQPAGVEPGQHLALVDAAPSCTSTAAIRSLPLKAKST